ncbi:MAG: amidohydrolase [Synechococcus sp.]
MFPLGELFQKANSKKLLGDISTFSSRISRRNFIRTGAFFVGVTAALGSQRSGSAQAQEMTAAHRDDTLLFVNGNILTVDTEFSKAEAMAIRGNRIVAVGSREAATQAAGNGARTINLRGKTVLPGFIEPHMHFALMAGLGHLPDIGPFVYPTTEEALQALKEIAAQTPDDRWVMVRQFDPSLQEGPEALTTRELDEISTTQPVFVLNASGHLAYANTKLFELAGITKDTPDPEGGEYFRYEDGTPNGAMTQAAYLPLVFLNTALMERLNNDYVAAGIEVSEAATALGITTMSDMATGGLAGTGDLDLFRAMVESGQIKVRVRANLFYERAADFDATDIKPADGDDKLRVVGWKMLADGSNQGFTGRQREPYLNTEDRGIFYIQPDELKEMVRLRAGQGWQLVLHGNGDAAIDSILDALESAEAEGLDVQSLRCRIEHCSILHDEQIERIKALNVGPSFLINHVHYWGHAMRDNVFGAEKVQLLDRCASVENAGIIWTNHSDSPVSPLGSLHKIRVAVARDLWKEPGNMLAPDERVSVEAAIRAITINAAWQSHEEDKLGSLEVGKLADFVVLAQDPRNVPPTQISDIRVLETWMDGYQVYADPC